MDVFDSSACASFFVYISAGHDTITADFWPSPQSCGLEILGTNTDIEKSVTAAKESVRLGTPIADSSSLSSMNP